MRNSVPRYFIKNMTTNVITEPFNVGILKVTTASYILKELFAFSNILLVKSVKITSTIS